MNTHDGPFGVHTYELDARRAVVAASAALVLCSGCSAFAAESNRDVRVMPDHKGEPVSQVELQQDIQRFTSDFMAHVGEAGERISEGGDPREREAILRRVLSYTSNALDIATGPFPEINVADMVVFVTLSRRAFERHWQPDVFGNKGRLLGDTLRDAERKIWEISKKILSDSQQSQFYEVIDDWERLHPDRYSVEGVRFHEFSSRAGEVSEARAANARGLFGQIKSATQSADQVLLVTERALFLAQRMPFLLRAQARLAVQDSLSDSLGQLREVDQLLAKVPSMQPMLSDLIAISNNATSAAQEARALVQTSEPYLDEIFGRCEEDRVGVRGEDEDKLSLKEGLVRVQSISENSLALARELHASVPSDPGAIWKELENRVDSMARRIAIYALIVGLGWAVAFWGGYYVVKRLKGA